jgi:predicted DNA-binding transcriptional regulator AlpA
MTIDIITLRVQIATNTKYQKERTRKRVKQKSQKEITETPLIPLNPVPRSAAFLGISKSLLWQEIKRGRIPTVRLGDRVFIRKTFLEQLVKGEVEIGEVGR